MQSFKSESALCINLLSYNLPSKSSVRKGVTRKFTNVNQKKILLIGNQELLSPIPAIHFHYINSSGICGYKL